MTSNRAGSPPKTVHVRAYRRRGPGGRVDVDEHRRSPPNGGASRGYLDPRNVAKARRQIEDYLIFFRQNAARDQARGVDNGRPLAIAHLEHFLDGTGTPVVLSSEQIAHMPALLKAEEANRKKFEDTFTASTKNLELNTALRGLADGETLEFTGFWDTMTETAHNRPGDYAAIGRSVVHSEGLLRAARKGDSIDFEGEVTHRLGVKEPGTTDYYRDPYDFDAGQLPCDHARACRRGQELRHGVRAAPPAGHGPCADSAGW